MTVPDDVRRRLMSQTSQLWGEPGVVDLGIGQPQDVLLPVEEFRRALSAAPVPPFQLQYGIERGDGALRVALADSLAPRYGAPVDPELMIISNGNSQAIDWCCAALTRPGDVVLVEDPTYFLARNIFAFHGIAHTEEELELHLMGLYLFKQKPTKERVRSLRAWFDRLLMINTERNLFPRDAFARRVAQAWDGLYHYLPRYGAPVAMEHLRLSRAWPMDRVMYLAKYRVNALLGRVANG